MSPPSKAQEISLKRIIKSLDETKKFLNAKPNVDWVKTFYQYANRVAHLYFLRTHNKLSAYMIFLYFINDQDMGGPTTNEEWEGAIKLMQMLLGLRRHKLSPYIFDIFIDVNDISDNGN